MPKTKVGFQGNSMPYLSEKGHWFLAELLGIADVAEDDLVKGAAGRKESRVRIAPGGCNFPHQTGWMHAVDDDAAADSPLLSLGEGLLMHHAAHHDRAADRVLGIDHLLINVFCRRESEKATTNHSFGGEIPCIVRARIPSRFSFLTRLGSLTHVHARRHASPHKALSPAPRQHCQQSEISTGRAGFWLTCSPFLKTRLFSRVLQK
jgi:hypothetical protein